MLNLLVRGCNIYILHLLLVQESKQESVREILSTNHIYREVRESSHRVSGSRLLDEYPCLVCHQEDIGRSRSKQTTSTEGITSLIHRGVFREMHGFYIVTPMYG